MKRFNLNMKCVTDFLKKFAVQVQKWDDTNKTLNKTLASVKNLSHQFLCCHRARLEELPIHQNFPNLKDKLKIKLISKLSDLLEDVNQKFEVLKDCRLKMKSLTETLTRDLNRVLDDDRVSVGSEDEPAYSMILLWHLDILEYVNTQLMEREIVLQKSSQLDHLQEFIDRLEVFESQETLFKYSEKTRMMCQLIKD